MTWNRAADPGSDFASPPGAGPSRPRRRIPALALGIAVIAIALTAASGAVAARTSPAGRTAAGVRAASGSPLVIADLAPFTGVDAALGPIYDASCLAATHQINLAGGVLGHDLTCKTFDTRGDPADAVPAAHQMFATTPNLALVIGCTSDEAASVVPIINANKMVMFCMTGQSEFDHIHYPYFFRLVPPDLEEAYAMIDIAHFFKHFTRIALAFGNDIGSQTFVGPAIAAIHKVGLKLVANQTLDLSATTFRTEAATVLAGHPQVVVTEALGSADATFLSELKQLNGGKMIPVIGTSATISPAWFLSVARAIGAKTLANNFWADNLVVNTAGAAFKGFEAAMAAVKSQTKGDGSFSTLLSAPGAVHLYDGMNLAALAMIEAKSTTPSAYKADLIKIGDGVPGAVVVNTFAEGVAALKRGKAIRYVGPGGPTSFDSYHDSPGIFQIDRYRPNGSVLVAADIPTSQLRAVS